MWSLTSTKITRITLSMETHFRIINTYTLSIFPSISVAYWILEKHLFIYGVAHISDHEMRQWEKDRERKDKYASTNFVHYDNSSKSHCRFFNSGKKIFFLFICYKKHFIYHNINLNLPSGQEKYFANLLKFPNQALKVPNL